MHRLAIISISCFVLSATGCTTNNAATSGSGAIAVKSTADRCEVSATTAPSGNIVLNVTNAGSTVTEFYLLGNDGLRIVGEVENIGPALSRRLVVQAAPGDYFAACKPGMTGDGIRTAFKVTDSGKPLEGGDTAALLKTATDQYKLYVREQATQLTAKTTQFADLYAAGKDDQARAMYPVARTHWERIEPVAESFGDLDPRLDLREADLEQDQTWTGWHRIEKDLWPPANGYTALTPAARRDNATQLVADTTELEKRIQTLEFDGTQLGNGAKELLDEVATGKVTGEEEIWSRTDLWDFQANVDGARIAFESLKPVLVAKKRDALSTTLTTRFADLDTKLAKYKVGTGFVAYTDLTETQVKELSDAVNALSEPLAELTSAAVL
jgi:iron uptake system component EfeO